VVCMSVGRSVTIVSPAKTVETIAIKFGLWSRVGPRKHVLDGVHIGSTRRIRLNRPCAAGMRPVSQITFTTCFIYLNN